MAPDVGQRAPRPLSGARRPGDRWDRRPSAGSGSGRQAAGGRFSPPRKERRCELALPLPSTIRTLVTPTTHAPARQASSCGRLCTTLLRSGVVDDRPGMAERRPDPLSASARSKLTVCTSCQATMPPRTENPRKLLLQAGEPAPTLVLSSPSTSPNPLHSLCTHH